MARSRETKIELTAYDDLFQTDESREEAKLSKIRDIPISEIDEFPDHPFKVLMDEDMEQLVESIKRNGQWKDRSYEPSAGDIIFFDWEGDGETDHVGIVEKCENGVVYTVEGNSGDACRQKQYTVGSSSIYGYGVPAY